MHKLICGVLMAALVLLAACAAGEADAAFAALPQGDTERGAALFAGAVGETPACASCHLLTGQNDIGPGLAGYADRAATQVAGKSAAEYTYESIVRPARFIVSGFSNAMYNGYGEALTSQQIADLIAFLLDQ